MIGIFALAFKHRHVGATACPVPWCPVKPRTKEQNIAFRKAWDEGVQ